MFSRSRAHIFVKRPDAGACIIALDRWFRRWGYRRRREGLPPGVPFDRHQEVRDWYVCRRGDWIVLAPEDISEALHIAYDGLHMADPEVPVIVSRAYKYGDWQLKAYHRKDLLFKVGDDPDDELKWVGRSLDDERIAEVTSVFGADPAFAEFLRGVVSGRPDPRDLLDGLGLPSLAVGFVELASQPPGDWDYHVWISDQSPLWLSD